MYVSRLEQAFNLDVTTRMVAMATFGKIYTLATGIKKNHASFLPSFSLNKGLYDDFYVIRLYPFTFWYNIIIKTLTF